jgi:hypothetical protein
MPAASTVQGIDLRQLREQLHPDQNDEDRADAADQNSRNDAEPGGGRARLELPQLV